MELLCIGAAGSFLFLACLFAWILSYQQRFEDETHFNPDLLHRFHLRSFFLWGILIAIWLIWTGNAFHSNDCSTVMEVQCFILAFFVGFVQLQLALGIHALSEQQAMDEITLE